MSNKMNRRNFLTTSSLLGAAGLIGVPAIVSACKGGSSSKSANEPLRQPGEYYIPDLPDKAIEGKALKAGVIGCGGRGSGAVENLLEAADGITVTALGDVFQDRIDSLKGKLKEKGQEVADDHCFVGFDAYQKVIDSGVDMVIIATPPVFRPVHFQYATSKGVHSFLEKPIAVDPKGYRTIMAAAKQAESKSLSVVTGTQRHHQREYVESFKKIQEGMIGRITGGNVYWNQGMLWYRNREKGWSDMEWMIRDWVNWKWLSGDHIVEQHVHNIDVFLWMTGMHPVAATGFGSRQRRITGDQYDNFSIDFEFENGVHLHSMCRQIDGCSNNVSEFIQGTKGSWNSQDFTIRDLDGNELWKYDKEAAQAEFKQFNPYVLEHVDWVNHIRKGDAHVEAGETGISSLAGVMGREAAYTGKTVKWDEISASELDYMPEKLELGPMDMSKYTVPVPGEAHKE
ncbi:MAG: Gfo/Idh/MocA family oxidoreductase [Bacteroidales bacterium]|jgi:predicted dehydrogenase|nr:Gfo/Idh/MocA family oxidoreductase [Bacteroidales bacterium]MEE3390948.1 Gfo/Idh/MocA family oxidoreductase [Candidatus Cryptobacteroides sp.]MCH3941909.1 Gfo/Idh/MocA family oxidoreductase [Bacteroidales bacterium]MCI2136427.1 Gfo/Idh/MocA family oxidoreductase [Bacteroidales bacterium]MDY6319932.1 Gfo/Idh/MocA family oxidoreductase [Bacteroidales bacterium]